MCGIVGIAGPRAVETDLNVVALMAHRGPDGEGRYVADGIALAMRRLAIIDLNTGQQPVSDETGAIVAVVNGEIYNYRELRSELASRGHVFRGKGDVEVVPHLYEELGERCFERLRGMFSVALWDARRSRLVLARDRFGIKPLYTADTPHGFAFASEVRPLLALGASREPDIQAIWDYLTLGYVPGTASAFGGIRRMEPGTTLTLEAGVRSSAPYWRLDPPEEDVDIEEVLIEAVRLHLRSDVPLALLLSGGLDSSLIGALAAAELDEPLRTFTVGFGHDAYDELDAARAVASAIGSNHQEVMVHADAARDLPAIVASLEEPLADSSAIPLWYVSRAVAAEVKVVLGGDGGDELFGGYSRYAWDPVAARVGAMLPAAALARMLERLPGMTGRSGRKDLRRRVLKLLQHSGRPEAERYLSWFALFSDDAKAELLRGEHQSTARVFSRRLEQAPRGATELGRLQYVDLGTMLVDDLLLKADKISMAHSLELRVPLLDHEVARAAFFLRDRDKVRRAETKPALREIVRRRLPPEIADRPKQGFEVPLDRWLREDLGRLAAEVISASRLAEQGIIDPAAAARLVRNHAAGRSDLAQPLYALLVLELWFAQAQAQQVELLSFAPAS